jgi:putative DNA primase/helicase
MHPQEFKQYKMLNASAAAAYCGSSASTFRAVILDAAVHGPYEARGKLEDWQRGVAALASGHALPLLAISAALAGPLLHLAGFEGGGLNFFGPSSTGKTTLLQVAASVWGRGGSPGYLRAWRATANGLEGAAASATDTALILDELGQVEAREAAAALYSLANGTGKARAARDGALREPKTWRALILSSGELPTETKLAEDRSRRARAGQFVRMLDVPADREFGFGAFDNAGPDGDPAGLAKAFKQAAILAYGTAGPEFVRRLIAEGVTGEDLHGMVSTFAARVVPAGADGQVDRAAQRFGLVMAAGELAIDWGLTPWHQGAAREAAAWALRRWIELRGGTEPAEARQALEQVRLFVEQYGESRFEPVDDGDARPVINRAGWRKGSGAERRWYVPPEIWRSEICNGLDAIFVARSLAERGLLARQPSGDLQSVVRVQGTAKRAYVLTAEILAGGEHAH